MTLVIVFGPPAVGRMTIGLELEKQRAGGTGVRVCRDWPSGDRRERRRDAVGSQRAELIEDMQSGC
jgi:hypothetical protein